MTSEPAIGAGPDADLRGMLASYPRSGCNWARYCIEAASGRPTPGRPLLHEQGAPIIARSHDLALVAPERGLHHLPLYGPDGAASYPALVLLLRNYKEGFAAEGRRDLARMASYIGNIRAFEGFDGPRLAVHYEDLIADFSWMRRILDLFGIAHDFTEADVERHRLRSLMVYHARRTAYTRADVGDFTFHSRQLTAAERAKVDAWFEAELGPALYARHLGRYHDRMLAYPA